MVYQVATIKLLLQSNTGLHEVEKQKELSLRCAQVTLRLMSQCCRFSRIYLLRMELHEVVAEVIIPTKVL